ncbi:phosphotransferase family protein [Actinoplanes sp. NPDC049265]|uniref:phosphotransferase family protein n=1 Tax=Actinoplanes sp. NPDC049265 TaxID=3363902 RepID=UPI00370FB196
MQSLPDDFDTDELAAAVTREWGVAVAKLEHAPVGFGSHHWTAIDPAGGRWFVTVDDLEIGRFAASENHDDAYARLSRALTTARALRDGGATFVVAPFPTAGGQATVRLAPRWAAALYPHVDGTAYQWDQWAGDEHRRGVLDMVVSVHAAPPAVREKAGVDDLVVPRRDAVAAALAGEPGGDGPYATRAAGLIREHADAVAARYARYDERRATVDRGGDVLTHGEPHPGNTMRTPGGWRLIDWDTTLVAPPERDLWLLGPAMEQPYAEATGRPPRPEVLSLYREWWDLADLAIGVARFRGVHHGGTDDDDTWEIISRVVAES